MSSSPATPAINEALAPVSPDRRVFQWHDHASLWFSLGVGLLLVELLLGHASWHAYSGAVQWREPPPRPAGAAAPAPVVAAPAPVPAPAPLPG